MTHTWFDLDKPDANGKRRTCCRKCGLTTAPHSAPYDRIYGTCPIPGWGDWLDHLALVVLGIGRERFAYVMLGSRFALVMLASYFGAFRVPGKPGSTLAKTIERITPVPITGGGCQSCAKHIERMDSDPAWCAANVPECVGYLREAAEKRRLPFHEWGAGVLVRRAIALSRQGS